MNRRDFIKTGLLAAALPKMSFAAMPNKTITIAKTSCSFEREPMVRPFGFIVENLPTVFVSQSAHRLEFQNYFPKQKTSGMYFFAIFSPL